ncbi:sensor histidine kinase [Amycolatopsis sp. MtRt-6]|uniref:sensor histidine kinase n=1 Tax=Amycolatopsis sp. MtRt-6 TaxID=2792782 RepID=UPI001A907639|nr:histidine kinase [Amycolatopsis sp. MtRt-6]
MDSSVVEWFGARWRGLGRRSRELIVDAAVTGICVTLGVVLAGGAEEAWWNAGAAALLGARRKAPSAVLLAIAALVQFSPSDAIVVPMCALYAVGAFGRVVPGALAVVATAVVFALPAPDTPDTDGTLFVVEVGVQVLVPLLAGAYVRRSRRLAAIQRDLVLTQERDRIAREMHDVLGHKLSLIALHAGRLELGGAADAETARLLGGTSRAAMQDLRQILRVLDAEPVTVDNLIDSSRRAGLRIESNLSGDLHELPPELADVVRRVVQEALTNVHKHAGPVDVVVEFRVVDGRARLLIRNCAPERAPSTRGTGTGRGLRTLAAQVAARGGRLTWGADADGGFEVAAEFPAMVGAR